MLATIDTTDFLYTCDNHLTDTGFASPVGESSDGAKKPVLSPEEIAEVKKKWEEQQTRKKEREAAKEKEDKGDKEEVKGSESKDANKKNTNMPGTLPTTAPPPPKPTHQRFTLHRDMFTLRLSEHRKRKQAAQAKKLAPRLPAAPHGGLSWLSLVDGTPAI